MKKVIYASVFVSALLVLSACGQKEYDVAVEEGNHALAEKNYEVAIAKFEQAVELEPEAAEPKALVAQAKSAYFDALYQKGEEALTSLAFADAVDFFTQAYELDQVKQVELLEKKLQAEELDKKQKELNTYANWVEKATKLNNQLSTEWRNASTDLSIGTIAVPEFKEKMQVLIGAYQELLTSAEEEILTISGELSVVHTNYLTQLQANYEQSRLVVIGTAQEGIKVEELLTKGSGLNAIQSQQALHIQALKSYAQAQGITFKEQ